LIFTACNEDVDERLIKNGISKSDVGSQSNFVPRLSKSEYGKKGLYKGINDEDITYYKSFLINFKIDTVTKGDINELIKRMEIKVEKRYANISDIIRKNGKTLIVDDLNDGFKILIVQEHPEREPDYMNTPYGWNSEETRSYLDGYLSGVFKDRVSELSDEEYKKMIAQVVEMKQNYIGTTVVVEELPFKVHDDSNLESTDIAIPFYIIDVAPQHPRKPCTGSHSENKKCFSDAISFFITENFNIDYDDAPGTYKIQCQLKISTHGDIVDIKPKQKVHLCNRK
jgi:hypothetical protein